MEKKVVIQGKDLCIGYRTGKQEKIVHQHLNFELHAGELTCLLGANGAGKSTMLNAVAGVFDVDQGHVMIDGVDVTKDPEYKRAQYIGRVFQDPLLGTAGDMWIEENLAIALRRGKKRGLKWGVTKDERVLYKKLLAPFDLGLEDRLSTKVALLSGGQRQALTLLMATLQKPDLLLLDEHTAALDPKTAAKVLEMTDKIISDNNLTAIMVTHNMKDAIVHGNRLIMMYNGRVVIDVAGEEKKKLTVPQLLDLFSKVSGSDEASDKLLLG